MKDLKYLFSYILPVVTFQALYLGGYWSFLTLIVAFGVIPLLELFFTGTNENLTEQEELSANKKRIFNWLLYLNVPVQYGLLVFFLFRIAGGLQVYEIVGMTISFGICCGILGINVAHELGHRKPWHERLMAKSLLLTSLYMHFYIEHNRGHHKNVSTDLDPASARYGETIYAFLPRSIIGAYFSAWRLENKRLRKQDKSVISVHNEMIRFQVIQVLFVALIYALFGTVPTLAFLGAAFIGYLLLESVNYIEHYGLRRKEIAPGRFERTMPCHSWNSNHTLGRILLFELTRHSDHHYLASRKYQVLRHFDESPQLPTGYPGSIVLAYFPPLWFYLLHKEINSFKATQTQAA